MDIESVSQSICLFQLYTPSAEIAHPTCSPKVASLPTTGFNTISPPSGLVRHSIPNALPSFTKDLQTTQTKRLHRYKHKPPSTRDAPTSQKRRWLMAQNRINH